jgi:hypothetical protein
VGTGVPAVIKTVEFTKQWFNEHMPRCAAEGSCNFTAIGGIFTLLDLAVLNRKGLYRKVAGSGPPPEIG